MKESGVEYKIANKHPGCQDTAQNEIFEWCKEGLLAGRHVVRLKIGELLFLHVSSYSFVFGVAVVHILDANLTLCSSSSQIPYDEINTHAHTHIKIIDKNKQSKTSGDPFVFGRGGEEVLEFREFGVEPTVIPGVSAAFSAPLLASIPVTHRGISNQVVMCTGYGKNNTSPDLIQYHPEQTVVFLMAVGRLRELCNNLISKANYPRSTPVGIVERAGCPEQRTVVGTMDNIADLAKRYDIKPPSTIVVGEVVNVLLTEEDFVWDDDVVEGGGGVGVGGGESEENQKEEMGRMMRCGYHGLVQSMYSSSS